MEFTKLSEVPVVETATDTDKVLIEQNGEIKRVPKTEVGGGGGNTLVFDVGFDMSNGSITCVANMTLDEAITAINSRELTGAAAYINMSGMTILDICICADYTPQTGVPSVMFGTAMSDLNVIWTADGFAMAE